MIMDDSGVLAKKMSKGTLVHRILLSLKVALYLALLHKAV